MTSQVVLLGVDYRHAPLALREQLSFSAGDQQALLRELAAVAGVMEVFLLCTCNRTEIYIAHGGGGEFAEGNVFGVLKRFRPEATAACEAALRTIERNEEAVTHLFRVAAGIDSQILGDTNIVMQVKQAHRAAAAAGTLGPALDRMVTESLRAAKRARRETAIGRGAASVGAAVLRSVREAFADVSQVHVLVLGGGEAGQDIARHLAKARFAGLEFSCRNPEQAAELARAFDGATCPWEEAATRLATIQVVVAATSARLPFLEKPSLSEALATHGRSPTEPLLIVDAGVPRNAGPDLSSLAGVRLVDLDGLSKEEGRVRAAREREVPRVEAILLDEVQRWNRWWRRRYGYGEQEAVRAGMVPTPYSARRSVEFQSQEQ